MIHSATRADLMRSTRLVVVQRRTPGSNLGVKLVKQLGITFRQRIHEERE